MFTSWKTTLLGLLLGGGISIDAFIQQGVSQGWKQAIVGLIIVCLGALMKDHDVTGGTKQQ